MEAEGAARGSDAWLGTVVLLDLDRSDDRFDFRECTELEDDAALSAARFATRSL